jgi:hypothetical protein
MKLYLATIDGNRRRNGYRTRFEWSEHLLGTSLYRRTLWETYRRLRAADFEPLEARWIIWDLVNIGQLADRHTDTGEA